MREAYTSTWLDFDGLVLNAIRDKGVIVSIWPLAVHQNSIRHPQLLSIIEHLPQVLHEEHTIKTNTTGKPMWHVLQ
jgi:hypothetical protein